MKRESFAVAISGASFAVACGSALLSYWSYQINWQNEQELGERISITCSKPNDDVKWLTNRGDTAPFAITSNWIATIANLSRERVEISSITLPINAQGTEIDTLDFPVPNRFGAEHTVTDRAISIEARKSTTVWFEASVHISKDAAIVSGLTNAKTLREANQRLLAKGIDLFGNTTTTLVGGDFRTMPPPGRNSFNDPKVRFSLHTAERKQFDELCGWFS